VSDPGIESSRRGTKDTGVAAPFNNKTDIIITAAGRVGGLNINGNLLDDYSVRGHAIVMENIKGVLELPSLKRVYFGGFSPGDAIALHHCTCCRKVGSHIELIAFLPVVREFMSREAWEIFRRADKIKELGFNPYEDGTLRSAIYAQCMDYMFKDIAQTLKNNLSALGCLAFWDGKVHSWTNEVIVKARNLGVDTKVVHLVV
jgi:hypothetical protein